MKINIIKKIIPFLLILTLFICISTVNANDMDDVNITVNQDIPNMNDDIQVNGEINNTSKIVKENNFNNSKLEQSSPDTIYVSKNGDDSKNGSISSPKLTLKNAFKSISNNGRIILSQGTYIESGILIDKNVTIIGDNTSKTYINANNKHLFTVDNNITLRLNYLYITNANATNGGAIYNRGTLKLDSVSIMNSKATNGAAIYTKGPIYLKNSTFVKNTAEYGSVIYSYSYVNLTTSTFKDNTATKMAAIYTTGKIVSFNSTFTSNKMGAIYVKNTYKNMLNQTRFITNSATNGAAIYNNNSSIQIVTNTYSANTATKSGGAIYSSGVLSIRDSTFNSNSAKNGAAITNTNDLYIHGSIIKMNNATTGGAIYNNHILTVKKSTIFGNIATIHGAAIYSDNKKQANIILASNNFSVNSAGMGTIATNGNGKLNITDSLFDNNKNTAIYIKTNQNNNIYNCTFVYNKADRGSAIFNNASKLIINKTYFISNKANILGSVIYNAKGETNIIYSALLNNTNVDIFNNKGTLTANSNWWGSNDRPTLSRIRNSTPENWIYLTLTVTNNTADETIKTTISFKNLYDGKNITNLSDGSLLPYLKCNMSLNGCGLNKKYNTYVKKGVYTATNKYTERGIIAIVLDSYDEELIKNVRLKNSTTKITGLFVQLTASVDSSDVKAWKNAGITDVYVLTKMGDTNPTKLKEIISLTKGTGILVHAWITCFKTGSSFDISQTRQSTVKNYVSNLIKIKGVAGVCLDYVRESGKNSNANSTRITNFVKDINKIIKSYDNNLVLSACVFAEKAGTKQYYGQDYAKMSPYVDVMLPMAYRYDYKSSRAWITDVIKYVVDRAVYSEVVGVIQTYDGSNSNRILTKTELENDAIAALSTDCDGIALFRYGLISSYPASAEKLS